MKEEFDFTKMVKILKKGVACFRCGYEWVPKNFANLPKNCPRCNSPYYNKPRQKDLKLYLSKGIKF